MSIQPTSFFLLPLNNVLLFLLSTEMQTEEIKVTENGKTITTLTLEDCEKYHGLKRCGGLAL